MTARGSGTQGSAAHRVPGPLPLPINLEEDVFDDLDVQAFAVPLRDVRGEVIEGAQCRFDPDLHAGPDAFADETPEERTAREDVAREVCIPCPLRLECLNFALRTLPEHGVWAGLTAEQIAVLADDLAADPPLSEVA